LPAAAKKIASASSETTLFMVNASLIRFERIGHAVHAQVCDFEFTSPAWES
jgi:hypothetical protein